MVQTSDLENQLVESQAFELLVLAFDYAQPVLSLLQEQLVVVRNFLAIDSLDEFKIEILQTLICSYIKT